MSGRILTVVGFVGTQPEPKKAQNGGRDYVKFRLSSKEYGEQETMWFNVLCYESNAKRALEKIKKGDYVMVTGDLLQSRQGSDGTVVMSSFTWLKQQSAEPVVKQPAEKEEFDFGIDFNSIPEVPYGS